MAVNDNDMELLHEYVDGELPVAECEGLWRRLAIERELVSELERLRSDHAARAMVWSGLEPDDAAVARLEARVMRAARREDFMSWGSNILRITASAAALILFGFSVGWMGHDRYLGVQVHPSSGASQVSASSIGASPIKYDVEVRDNHGNLLIPIQRFDNLEDAEQFESDLKSAQSNPNATDWNVVPATNKF
jgi:anti-sigma factor RsiW